MWLWRKALKINLGDRVGNDELLSWVDMNGNIMKTVQGWKENGIGCSMSLYTGT